jgi:3-oxoacyl-[acyl-carrier-protein] synthase-1
MRLALTGTAMISAVAPDLANSCAAIRAGLQRSEPLSYFSLLDSESQETIPPIGRPILGFTEGFFVQGLWIRLGVACLQHLVNSAGLPSRFDNKFWAATGLLAITPPITDGRFESDDTYTTQQLKSAYLGRLFEIAPFPISNENMDVICIGHAGTIAALARAGTMIATIGLERVIILAVDSYLDPMTLDWLVGLGRLKTAENPVGLIPGEAGACCMVESLVASQTRRAAVGAVIQEPALGSEDNHYFSGKKTQGVALAGAISRALSQSASPIPFSGDVIADLNGEEWRAYELACARVRVGSQLDEEAALTFPANSLGETGSASGAVAICMAARSLQRGYASQKTTLVVSSGDYGQVGAVCLSKA